MLHEWRLWRRRVPAGPGAPQGPRLPGSWPGSPGPDRPRRGSWFTVTSHFRTTTAGRRRGGRRSLSNSIWNLGSLLLHLCDSKSHFNRSFGNVKAFNLKKLKLSLSPSQQWPQAACGWGATAGKFLRQTKGSLRTVFRLRLARNPLNPFQKPLEVQ